MFIYLFSSAFFLHFWWLYFWWRGLTEERTKAEGARGLQRDVGPQAEGLVPQVPAPALQRSSTCSNFKLCIKLVRFYKVNFNFLIFQSIYLLYI